MVLHGSGRGNISLQSCPRPRGNHKCSSVSLTLPSAGKSRTDTLDLAGFHGGWQGQGKEHKSTLCRMKERLSRPRRDEKLGKEPGAVVEAL